MSFLPDFALSLVISVFSNHYHKIPQIRLYYTIRVLQDFYKDKILKDKELLLLPKNLQHAIKQDKETLIDLFNTSTIQL